MKALPLLCVLLASCAATPPDSFEGRKISDLKIRYTGGEYMVPGRLQKEISTRPGMLFSTARIDADIKALNDTGLVSDVRFLVNDSKGPLELIAEVTLRPPTNSSVYFTGNTAFSDHKLGKVADLKSLHPTNRELLAASRKIETFYQSYGYGKARVTCRRPPDRAVVFVINEGPAPDRKR